MPAGVWEAFGDCVCFVVEDLLSVLQGACDQVGM